ncbi:hypothetical protein SDC9_155638 [bioreactor metagenome]|uniref:Uncharacterized protein n=1 Tax=bioreactor metagenome TaxID=1076179 RepID=A0A645F3Z0_9ZZZZ
MREGINVTGTEHKNLYCSGKTAQRQGRHINPCLLKSDGDGNLYPQTAVRRNADSIFLCYALSATSTVRVHRFHSLYIIIAEIIRVYIILLLSHFVNPEYNRIKKML